MRIISGYPCVRCGGTLAADPDTYGVRVVCLQCGHDCHVTLLPGRGGHHAGQELPDDDSPVPLGWCTALPRTTAPSAR